MQNRLFRSYFPLKDRLPMRKTFIALDDQFLFQLYLFKIGSQGVAEYMKERLSPAVTLWILKKIKI